MIISQVIGGLGNQMFQYAAGRSLSLKNNTRLALDVAAFEGYGLHQGFELNRVFSAPIALASDADRQDMLGWRRSPVVRRLLAKLPLAMPAGEHFVQEPHFHYWPGFEQLGPNSYLAGYWQSEKYFSDFSVQIRMDFTFRATLVGKNAELAQVISASQAVSLHVRRGDYVSNPKTNSVHGVCGLDYYHAAIEYIREIIDAPHIYIFSDDIEWARSHLRVDLPCDYVGHNSGTESHIDMWLMSLCKHNIIANSSFSWWGAWLNAHPKKIVIAPRQWFAYGGVTTDLISPAWTQL